MPRIYNTASEPLDFCKRCFPSKKTAEIRYGDVRKTGEGPDDRGNCFDYDSDHPPYSDTDYTCETCGKRLSDRDN